jgi:hypothetical protein
MKALPSPWHELVMEQDTDLLRRSVVRLPARWINARLEERNVPLRVTCLPGRTVLRLSTGRDDPLAGRLLDRLGNRKAVRRIVFGLLPREIVFELSCRYLDHKPDGTLILAVQEFSPRFLGRLASWALPGFAWDVAGKRLTLFLPRLPGKGSGLGGATAMIVYGAVSRVDHAPDALHLAVSAGGGLAAFFDAYAREVAEPPRF